METALTLLIIIGHLLKAHVGQGIQSVEDILLKI